MPGVSDASSTTAPAPSPNSTQVVRSSKSRMRENTSAPITSALGGGAGADHGVGHGQRVDEAAADRLHVEGRAAGDAQLVLQDAGRRREHHVRRRRRDDDQVDVGRLAAGSLERVPGGLRAEVAGRDVGSGEVARADAGAFDDPVIGGLDARPASSAARSALVTRRGGR
jgi:hypothetical protein